MNLEEFGKRIKARRKELGYKTQADLGKVIFVSAAGVSRWEQGSGTPDLVNMLNLSKVLNMDITEILTGVKFKES